MSDRLCARREIVQDSRRQHGSRARLQIDKLLAVDKNSTICMLDRLHVHRENCADGRRQHGPRARLHNGRTFGHRPIDGWHARSTTHAPGERARQSLQTRAASPNSELLVKSATDCIYEWHARLTALATGERARWPLLPRAACTPSQVLP